jgi:DHA1 family tetracycline resistance protein-like MFS transporter
LAGSRRSPLFALFVTVFIDLLGFGLFIPTLPYIASRSGIDANDAQIGMLQASFSLSQFVFAPFWGWLSDRIGRRPVLLWSIFGGGLSYLLFGLAGSLPMLFVARALGGGFAANISTAQAFVADVTPPEGRAKGMGVIGAAFGLGFTLGPPIGGFLAGGGHYEWPAFVAAGLCGFNLILAWAVLPESRPADLRPPPRRSRFAALAEAMRTPLLADLTILFFVVTFAFANMEQALVLATKELFNWTPADNGKLLGLVGILIVIMQGGLIGRLSRRFGERSLLITGTIAMSSALLMLALSALPWGYWVAMFPLALGSGLANPSLSSLISRAAPAAERGGTLGVSQSAGSLARILGPAWAGWSFQHLSKGAPFATGAAVMALGAYLAVALPRLAATIPDEARGVRES